MVQGGIISPTHKKCSGRKISHVLRLEGDSGTEIDTSALKVLTNDLSNEGFAGAGRSFKEYGFRFRVECIEDLLSGLDLGRTKMVDPRW